MSHTHRPTSFAALRSAVNARTTFTKARKIKASHNYSSYWMGADDTRFYGLTSAVRNTSIVQLVKLTNYRRAITNFVKILTGKDVPVIWAGSQSATDGQKIILSTAIKDNNFDVHVGLALHEASHILLTTFDTKQKLLTGEGEFAPYAATLLALLADPRFPDSKADHAQFLFGLFNWIEDRRIDNFVFSTCPGYKAYYHKLYDYYWNDKNISLGFLSKKYRNPLKRVSYDFHITNMMNGLFNTKALPGLEEIAKIIDLSNISRLKNSTEAAICAAEVCIIVYKSMLDEANKKPFMEPTPKEEQHDREIEEAFSKLPQELQDMLDQMDSETGGDGGDEDESGDGGAPATQELSAKEEADLEKAIAEQKKFLEGDVDKKSAKKKMLNSLTAQEESSAELTTVHNGTSGIILNFSNPNKCTTLSQAAADVVAYTTVHGVDNNSVDYRKQASDEAKIRFNNALEAWWSEYLNVCRLLSPKKIVVESITRGLEMGALLGKQLQICNETRERVDTRLRSGKIDKTRLAHAGYGIESVFRQMNISSYKNANIHISLDASGSMDGDKWFNTIQTTAAIAKAATYVQGLSVQVSLRGTQNGDVPVTILIYDSAKASINHLRNMLIMSDPNTLTPEGLCFESLLQRNYLKPSTKDMDSYFINISDGMPYTHSYGDMAAIQHTAAQVQKIRNLGIQVISFFVSADSAATTEHNYKMFTQMYGKEATTCDPNSVISIARELNKKFLAAKITK